MDRCYLNMGGIGETSQVTPAPIHSSPIGREVPLIGSSSNMKSLFIILFAGTFLFVIDSSGRTIKVGQHESVRTIKEGVSKANPGDTLLVQPGTYREGNIILEKSITIRGEAYPVLDGENKYEILTIHADHVVVTGLKFINTGIASMNDLAAIKALQCKNLRILNNQFENTFFGIYLANSSESGSRTITFSPMQKPNIKSRMVFICGSVSTSPLTTILLRGIVMGYILSSSLTR